jgi:hypothetical protein
VCDLGGDYRRGEERAGAKGSGFGICGGLPPSEGVLLFFGPRCILFCVLCVNIAGANSGVLAGVWSRRKTLKERYVPGRRGQKGRERRYNGSELRRLVTLVTK